jgi:beta-galactosidase
MYISHRNGGMFDNVPTKVEEKDNTVTVTYTYFMPTTPASKCQVAYTVFGDGTIETKLMYDPVEGLPDMPEFGMMFWFNADYDNLTWYGMGPDETYADRRHGAKLGIYSNKVADNMAKYLVPQECGNKVGVRYARLVDAKGRGMMFEGDELSFSALPYTPHELENAAHVYELPQVHHTIVRVALAQMGVGGDDSWGSLVHPEYHIDVTKPLEFTFRFKGI